MIRIRAEVVAADMTVLTPGRRSGIDSADVAAGAWSSNMHSGQEETRLAVVKGGSLPANCSMTHGAIVRKAAERMVRIGGSIIISQVTGITVLGRACISFVDVALNAGDGGMGAGQGKGRLGRVVELRPGPPRRRVAGRAVLRKARRRMVRVLRPLVGRQVARIARARRPRITVVRMARRAAGRHVRPGQRKLRPRIVVELRPCPPRRRVAGRAVLRKARRRVLRVLRPLVGRQVA